MAAAALHAIEEDAAVRAASSSSVANQFVTFTCGDRAFGIDIMAVREIRSWSPVTEMPNQPYAARGVLDIRGSIVQVYDLASLLGGSSGGEVSSPVVLVVSLKRADIGLVVDAVSDIIFAKPEDLRTPPGGGGGLVSLMVKDGERLISILDLAAMFPAEADAAYA